MGLASLPRPGDTPINDSLHWASMIRNTGGLGVWGTRFGRHRLRRSVSASGGYPPDLYLPQTGRPARAGPSGRLLIAAGRAGTLRVAPVRWSPPSRRLDCWETAGWPLCIPLFVALDLARTPTRAVEVLAGVGSPGRWQRVPKGKAPRRPLQLHGPMLAAISSGHPRHRAQHRTSC